MQRTQPVRDRPIHASERSPVPGYGVGTLTATGIPKSSGAERPIPAPGPRPRHVERPLDELQRLKEENLRLRRGMASLKREAEKNTATFQRFHRLELSLLDADSLPQLLDRIVTGTREILALDAVSLIIHDPEHEVRNLLAGKLTEGAGLPAVRFLDGHWPQGAVYGRLRGVWLGPFCESHRELFGKGQGLGSIALLPLVAQGCQFGSLNLASRDPGRYTRSHGRDFHRRLASVAAVSLQNAINRERLVVDSHTDRLTLWHNRRYLDAHLPEEVARALRYGEALSCLILDIDHFKGINDRYGHLSGDAVLRDVACLIRGQLRRSDLAVRYGGEEFVVFLGHASEQTAFEVAERIRCCIAEARFCVQGDQGLRVTLSGGLAEMETADGGADPVAIGASMLRRADAALYRAKAGGRNRIACHGRA